MSGIIAKIIGLRLVGTTKYITKQNTTKCLQSMCHVRNRCSHITKNPIKPAQKKSAGYWKTIKICSIPLTIGIYYAYIIKTNDEYQEFADIRTAARDETLQYSIIPPKTITSSVLFGDSKIELFTEKDYLSLENDNTRNLIIGEELDANIQKPFPRGEPIPVKFDRFTGLLDNGKLTLTTEDGDTTFTFHHTLSLEVKKTSTTLQDEIAAEKKKPSEIRRMKINEFNAFAPGHKVTFKTSEGEYEWPSESKYAFPIIGNFIFSYEDIVKIQADESDEVYHLIHNVNIECDRKLDENLQNIIATKKVFVKDMIPGGTLVIFDIGSVVFKTQDGRKIIVRQKIDFVIFENGQKTVYLDGLPRCTLDYP